MLALKLLKLKMSLSRVSVKSGQEQCNRRVIQLNIERLRKPMQTISDFILKSAGIKTSDVIEFNQAKAANHD